MKKSNIIIAAGCFIVITAFLCINPNDKTYAKQKNFSTVNEVMQQLENNPLMITDENARMKETEALKECLSKRKRMTGAELYFEDMSIKEVVDLDQKQKDALLENYMNCRKNLSKKSEFKNAQVERIIAEVDMAYANPGDKKEKYQMDFIFVDEGEGLVIDYITRMHIDEQSNDEKGDLNVEG